MACSQYKETTTAVRIVRASELERKIHPRLKDANMISGSVTKSGLN